MNPYHALDDFCFWSRAMTAPAPGHVDPVVRGELIGPQQKVSTLGSCFAQHLSRHLSSAGLNYFVAEMPPAGMDGATAKAGSYGVFSARYGNVYTVRQAVQLFDRAFGTFQPKDCVWKNGGRFVDAFRPQIEPGDFATEDEVIVASRRHLGYVREVFEQSDWFVFTLGLTEAWRSKLDGAIYPVAPGVAGGSFDPERHEFVNFTASQVRDDLLSFIGRIRGVNPGAKILLTVSPVPLIATYERRHVWVSTTYSKAALRVAADEAERTVTDVIYFPSYEIITSPAAGGRYFADDLRQVTDAGVKHVMRVFDRHFLDGAPRTSGSRVLADAALSAAADTDLVCDEEVIQNSLKVSGLIR